MTYGCSFSIFFKDNIDLSNQEKLNKSKEYSIGDMLILLRNIEESTKEYDMEIISGLYSCLCDKGIMCI